MESDKPKKKKKYVLANPYQPKPQPQTIQKLNPQEQTEGKALERSRFDYTFEQIVNHLLARLLPNSNYTIKLSERLIFGEEKKLDDFVIKLDNNIKYTAGVTLELEEEVTKEDIDYKMNEAYRGKTFNSKLIQMSVKDFFDGSKYERDYANFLSRFKDKEKQRIYVRLNRCYLPQFLDSVKKEATLFEKEEEEDEEVEPVKRRGNRTIFKEEIASIQLQADFVQIPDVMKFFNRSEKCNYDDLQVTKIKDQQGTLVKYKFVLTSYKEERDLKLEAFNYYFHHENIVMLPLKDSKHKDQIIQQYGDMDESHIHTKIIKGYKSSKWQQKSLLYKVRTKNVSSKKTNYTNQYFQAIHLRGLYPAVRDLIDELEQKINEVPLDDIKQELFIEFSETVKDYIRNSKRTEIYIEKFIKTYMQQFDSVCSIDKIKFPCRGVKLSLTVHNSAQDQFEHVKQNIEKAMPKYVTQQTINLDFVIDQQLLKKLQEEEILVVDHADKAFIYLTSTEDISNCNQKIQKIIREFQSVGEQSIQVVGLTKKLKYLDLIKSLKQEKEEYKQILISDPDPQDKVHFKINFYGPRKKNDKFYEDVQKRIDKIQKESGQYLQYIDQRIGKLIVEDQKIQQKIEEENKISLIVSSSKVDAYLELNLGKKGEIFILKTNNLEKVPLGCNLFFENKEAVLDMNEKYLEKFQINVKRMKQSKWHEENERTRKYTLFFKENFQITEMLAEVLKIWLNDKDVKYLPIGLFLPKVNPHIWLRKLFDQIIQDPNLSHIPFKLFILDFYKLETIQKIVDLLEYSPFTNQEEIEIQWFCQNKSYSKSANLKINDAIANRQSEVMLGPEDVEATTRTHICDLSKMTIYKITNYGTNNQVIPFVFGFNEVIFKYKNYTLKFPQSQYNKVVYHQKISHQSRFYINLPFYLIDLTQLKQINIFTNFQRPISKVQNKKKITDNYQGYIRAFYHNQMTELIYNFQESQAKNLQQAVRTMEEYQKGLWIKEEVKIKDIQDMQFRRILKERIQTRAQESSLQYELDPSLTKITVETCILKDLQRFKNVIENEVDYILELSQRSPNKIIQDFQYPSFWEPQQNEIQTFEVPKNSQQFASVQALFTCGSILSLTRIQNKVIYKRYYDELEHLAHLNGKSPLLKKLFHGTHQTPSDVIYADKEDGFNINYSSENNLLGRGIYFAEKSEYSTGYISRQYFNGISCRGMLLCQVIVGDSQEMLMSHSNRNVIDTRFKPNGNRYESMLGKHSICNIYVVYKNRRAYPQYLIKF